MDTEESDTNRSRFVQTLVDWGIALGLTVLGFWLLSWWRTPDLPDRAPDWTLQSIQGETLSLSDFEGQTVVLNFWATWCGPCKMEIPEFRAFVDEYPDIPVLGIAVDGSAAKLAQFSKQNKMNYPILLADRDIQQAYNVSSLPMTVVVGPTGEVQDVHSGIMLKQQLEWAVK